MTLFELVKITLDELYKRAQLQYGGQTDAEIRRFVLECLASCCFVSDERERVYEQVHAAYVDREALAQLALMLFEQL